MRILLISLFIALPTLTWAAPTSNMPASLQKSLQMRLNGLQPKIKLMEQQPDPIPILEPVRQAKLKVGISKIIVTQSDDGSYSYSKQSVCQKEIPVDVYDARGLTRFGISSDTISHCESTLNQQSIKLNIFGAVVMGHGVFWNDEPSSDFKAFWGNIWVENQGLSIPQLDRFYLQSDALVRGLDATSLITTAAPNLTWDCGTAGDCRPSLFEFFASQMEVVDQP